MLTQRSYPALLGRVSMHGQPLPPLGRDVLDGATLLFSHPSGSAELYWLGEARDLRHGLVNDVYRVLVGAVDAIRSQPLARVGPTDGLLSDSSFNGRPQEIDGAYVAVDVGARAGAGAEVRIQTDKYGFRTLYYYETPETFFFSTHLTGIRRLLHDQRLTVNREALLHLYHFGVTSNRDTLLAGVRKVPAATVVAIRPTARTEQRYFDPLDLYHPGGAAVSGGEDAVCRRIDGAMTAAVGRRLQRNGRLALAVSGGVDSGFIAKKLKEAGAPVRAYNLAYGTYYNEFDRINRLEADLGLEIARLRLEPQQIWQTFERASAIGSEPIAFNDAALTVLAGQAQVDGASTVWDGDGADRLFLGMCGYLKYARAIRVYNVLRRLGVARMTIAALGAAPVRGSRKLATVWRNWTNGIPPYPERHYGDTPAYDHQREERIFQLGMAEFWQTFQQRVPTFDFGLFLSYVGIRMCPERFFHTPTEQQYALGVRPVSPYWDDELVGIGLSLPTALKLKGRQTKYVLRRAAALGGDDRYWMQSKIGLQSAFAFWTSSTAGSARLNEIRAQIRRSDEFRVLQGQGETAPHPDRLVPYWVWKAVHAVRV